MKSPREPEESPEVDADPTLTITGVAEGRGSGTVAGTRTHLEVGARIGRYLILGEFGAGGMGIVYEAYDPELGRHIALKVLAVSDADESRCADNRRRLQREAQALARLSHPNVVAVYDVGVHEEDVFIAMELVRGSTLRHWLTTTKPRTAEILAVMRDAGRGLAAAHDAAIVHRDFKPENVVVCEGGQVRVLDFGLARTVTGAPDDARSQTSGEPAPERPALTVTAAAAPQAVNEAELLSSPVTHAGVFVGTPRYMAPEQFDNQAIDARIDQFAFCVVLFEALYGVRPFKTSTGRDLRQCIAAGRVPAPKSEHYVPQWLRRVILRGLSADPDDRYASMQDLLAALQDDPSVGRRKTIGRVLTGCVLAAAGVLAWQLSGATNDRCGGGRERIAMAWNRSLEEQTLSAFAKTGKTGARSTAASVGNILRAYATAWSDMHRDACEDTWVRGEQSAELLDLRMACLSDRERDLVALSRVLTSVNPTVMEKAVEASQQLLPVARCADVEALTSATDLPSDPDQLEQLRSIQDRLARARALEGTGSYAEGVREATLALASARKLAYGPALAQALFRLGNLQGLSGKHALGEQTLWEAIWAAEAAGLSAEKADAISSLVYLVGYQAGRPGEVQRQIEHADATLHRVQGQPEIEVQWALNKGIVHYVNGEYERARAIFEQAHQTARSSLGNEHYQTAKLENALGNLAKVRGDYDQAIVHHERAVQIRLKILGPHHGDVAQSLYSLGTIYKAKGDPKRAIEYYLRCLDIAEAAFGSDHPNLATYLSGTGNAYLELKDFVRAERHIQRAVSIWSRDTPEHPKLAFPMGSLGDLHLAKGDPDAAIAYYKRSAALREQLGSDHPQVALSLGDLGRAYLQKRDTPNAIAVLSRARLICEKRTCDAQLVPEIQFNLARAVAKRPAGRSEAVALARAASNGYGELKDTTEQKREVDAWLAQVSKH